MGTRSRIGVINKDNSITSIYCHWDGYLDHNGRILLENYTDLTKIRSLMRLGNLSSLGAELGKQHDWEDHAAYKGTCNAYGRDRGETDEKATKHKNIKQLIKYLKTDAWEEFAYLYDVKEGAWGYSESGAWSTWKTLTIADCNAENE